MPSKKGQPTVLWPKGSWQQSKPQEGPHCLHLFTAEHTIWDHAIELLPNALVMLPARLLLLNRMEQEEMQKFIKEHLRRGTIQELWSPYAANFFFIKKKDRKL
jgi:hypothetical protein